MKSLKKWNKLNGWKNWKHNFFALIFFALSTCVFCEESVVSVNRNTAIRCMKAGEKRLLEKNWDDALYYAEMAISYDENISDVYYIKAAAEYNLSHTKNEVLKSLRKAFDVDEWIGYNKNGARILFADMLSEIGDYEKSMEILDEKPFIYSSDAEFIRVKNGYRIGTAESLEKARDRVFSACRVYPKDSRFMNLFFMFEGTFKNMAELNLTEYEVPSVVQKIADGYIERMPYWENPAEGIDVLAAMFAAENDRIRLLKSIGTRNEGSPLYAIVALKNGVIGEYEACRQFFEFADYGVNVELLEMFASLLKEEDSVNFLKEHLNAYGGVLGIDTNLDFKNEIEIQYERGRAKEIHYDSDGDGIEELVSVCDFGSPVSLTFPVTEKRIYYSIYPQVSSVVMGSENELEFEKGSIFSFVNDDFVYSPFEMLIPDFLSDLNINFYVPFVLDEIAVPSDAVMSLKASSIEYSVNERPDAKVVLYFAGKDVSSADFFAQGRKYAYCIINENYENITADDVRTDDEDESEKTGPFSDKKNCIIRHVDSDGDGIFETTQFFNRSDAENPFVAEPEDETFVQKVFGKIAKNRNLYLERVEIDNTGDNVCNYSEDYQSYGGKIVTWDFDGDGLFDIRYTKYPKQNNGDDVLLEDSEFRGFVDKNHVVKVSNADGIPFMLTLDDKELKVTPGFTENVFWVGDDVDSEEEALLIEKLNFNIEQAVVGVVSTDKNGYFVIRIGKNFFLWK